MAQVVDCPCGTSIRGEDEDQLVSGVEAHVQEHHPEMAGTMSREKILEMAHDA